MKLSKFRYKLPQELIALYPTPNRDECRLMVLNRKTGNIVKEINRDEEPIHKQAYISVVDDKILIE